MPLPAVPGAAQHPCLSLHGVVQALVRVPDVVVNCTASSQQDQEGPHCQPDDQRRRSRIAWARLCQAAGCRLIHISTTASSPDARQLREETDTPDAEDPMAEASC